jgi:hypothetical protein
MSDLNSSIPAGSRPIPSAPGYCVCDGGKVWSSLGMGPYGRIAPWHVIKPRKPQKSGHIQIDLQVEGKRVAPYIHQLVLEAFVGPCPPGLEGCHNDGNPGNNFVSNLRYDTHENNQADMVKHGRSNRGERASWSILKESDIPEVFRLSRQGLNQREIGEIYGVNQATISSVLRRTSWPHVDVSPWDRLPVPVQAR